MKRAEVIEVIIVLICMERNAHTFWLFEDLRLVAHYGCFFVRSCRSLKYSVLTDNILLQK